MDENGGSNKKFECGKGEKQRAVILVHTERHDARGFMIVSRAMMQSEAIHQKEESRGVSRRGF